MKHFKIFFLIILFMTTFNISSCSNSKTENKKNEIVFGAFLVYPYAYIKSQTN
jgi:hypothetical protein